MEPATDIPGQIPAPVTSRDGVGTDVRPEAVGGSLVQMPWALADQILISATNFITIILLARGFTQAALGEFTLVYSALLFFNTIQAGVITQPHNILGVSRHGRRGGDYKLYTSATFFGQAILCGVAALLALLAWVIALRFGWSVAPLLLSLAPALVAWQLLEFARRVLYTEGRIAAAMATDVIACTAQIAGVAWLCWRHELTGPAALNMIAITSLLGAAFGLWKIRRSFAPGISFKFIRENWHFGKWIVGGEIVGNWLSVQLFVYLSAAMLGAAAAGILRAVHTIFGPARILADVLCTMLPIHFSRVFTTHGKAGLHTQLVLCHLVAVPLLGGYCLLVAVFAQPLLRLLYGDRYAGAAVVLAVYAVAAFASYLMMIVAAALRARRSTRELFNGQLIGSLIAIPIGWVSIRLFGVPGTALGMLVSYLLITLLLWRTYRLSNNDGVSQSTIASAPLPCHASGGLLQRVLKLLDQAGIPYCITHGYQNYPQIISSDVDLIMPADVVRSRLAPLLHANQQLLGAQIVQWIRQDSDYIVLMGVGESLPSDEVGTEPAVEHLCLDISTDYALCNRVLVKCDEIISTRRRHAKFWIPSPELEFICCLLRRIVKQHLSSAHAARLSELYAQAPEACAAQIARFVTRADRALIERAASSGDWQGVQSRLAKLQSQLLLTTAVGHPLSLATRTLVDQWRRLQRWCSPRHGLHVVFLGPDGAGKSSVVRAVRQQLGPAFFNTACRSFPPALMNRGDEVSFSASARPHDVAQRSPIASTLRAVCYWLIYQTIGHLFTIRVERARCFLSLNDRHFVDTLVDPRRYRYAGPKRLLNWIWRVTPKPDLLILLAAPPQVIQSRKPEVTPQETARQCLEYRALARNIPMAAVVDTSVPLSQTVREVAGILITHMAERARQQLRLTRESDRHAGVRCALALMNNVGTEASWLINKIGSGDQANVYEAVCEIGGTDISVCHGSVVVKLFRPDRPEVATAVAEEFESLRQLHALLDDLTIDGWRIRIPKPVRMCQQPPAIIMTKVPGRPLNALLAETAENSTADAISHVLVSALERFWADGRRIYGDFTLSNVLCDPENREISLVDPGMPEKSYECPEIARRWYPASRDVAFMIFDAATSIRQNIGHPILRRHQWQMLVQMLKTILGKLPTHESRRDFLAEVDACSRIHLKHIAVSCSLSGGRHFLVRCIASLRMRLLFARLRNAAVLPSGLDGTDISECRAALADGGERA